jgi:EpsI family protein
MVIRQIIAILIVGLGGIYAAELRSGRSVAGGLPALEELPREIGAWRSEDFETSDQTARVLAADVTLQRRYHRGDGRDIWVFVAYFAQQQVNSQIHSPRNCLPGGGWRVRTIEEEAFELNGRVQRATRMRIARDDRSQDVLYWFCTQGGTVVGEYALKWDLVKNSLARRPTNAAFVRYNAQTPDSSAVHEIMEYLDPALDQILGEVGLRCR